MPWVYTVAAVLAVVYWEISILPPGLGVPVKALHHTMRCSVAPAALA